MDETKLQHIEALLAHQERQIQDLSDMAAQQWDEIDMLKSRLKRTTEKLAALEHSTQTSTNSGMEGSVADFAASEKPPHY